MTPHPVNLTVPPPARVTRFFYRFINRIVKHSDDPFVQMRAKVLLLIAALSTSASLIYGVMQWRAGRQELALLFATSVILVVATLVRLWLTGKIRECSHIGVAVSYILTTVATYLTGGFRLANVAAFFVLFIAPVFLFGRRGLGWTFLAFATAVTFQVATLRGYTFPEAMPLESRELDAFVTWLYGGVIITGLALMYDGARRRAIRGMQEASRAKSAFLANLSHEIRTPLHVIMGVHRRLEEAPLSPAHASMLRVAQDNATSLLSLFDDLLDLARTERSTFAIDNQPFAPVPVFESVVRVLETLAQEKGISVHAHVAAAAPRWLQGDARRIRQIMLNLGMNAVKFTDRGSIELRLDMGEAGPSGLHFEVRDTGIGISSVDRDRIFEPFAQVDTSAARQNAGAGLGLAIVAEFVRRMNGKITVQSRLGAGSVFLVDLPLRLPVSAPTAVPASTAETGAGRFEGLEVLVVDDLEINRSLTRAMLERLGCTVREAHNGAAALEQSRNQRPDLVLLDVQMPSMDGLEVARRLRQREQERAAPSVPIIALTGRASASDEQECLAAGMNGCLFKPFGTEELHQLLLRHLPS